MPSDSKLSERRNSDFTKNNQFTIPLSDHLSLRIYSDTTPRNSFIADLQKGLILVYRGVETIGEGTGFGVPVILYPDETYFSGSSRLYFYEKNGCKIICKQFFMNRIQRMSIGKTKLENQKLARTHESILRHVAEAYQKHRHLRFLTAERVYSTMGIKTGFVKTDPAGIVTVTYRISQKHVNVKTDFNLLKKNQKKTFVLNEQGSTFFRMYSDSEGAKLVDKQIGAWGNVETEWASITDVQGRVGFRLWKAKNSTLRRGREFLKGCRDWVGLDYEISPKNNAFAYDIEILG